MLFKYKEIIITKNSPVQSHGWLEFFGSADYLTVSHWAQCLDAFYLCLDLACLTVTPVGDLLLMFLCS